MTTETELILDRIIESDCHDPFLALGFHVIGEDPAKSIIRAFQPHAESLKIIVDGEKTDMYKMRDEGLFEAIFPRSEPFDYTLEATYYNDSTFEFKDPYRHTPQLSEEDRYLFNHGTHYDIFDKLGSHLTTIDGVNGVIFRVWAPNARRVSVIGDFNAWDGRVHQMRILDKSGIWELFLPDLTQGEAYKFEIRAQDMSILEKSDPFQFFGELRPKTASVVWDINDYKWNDDQWLTTRKKTSSYESPMSIYEVHLSSWQRDPGDPSRFLTYKELATTLVPYVKKMGFTISNSCPSWNIPSTNPGDISVPVIFPQPVVTALPRSSCISSIPATRTTSV